LRSRGRTDDSNDVASGEQTVNLSEFLLTLGVPTRPHTIMSIDLIAFSDPSGIFYSLDLSQDLDLLALSMQIVKVQVLARTPHVAQSTSERDGRLLEPVSLTDLALDAPFLDV